MGFWRVLICLLVVAFVLLLIGLFLGFCCLLCILWLGCCCRCGAGLFAVFL